MPALTTLVSRAAALTAATAVLAGAGLAFGLGTGFAQASGVTSPSTPLPTPSVAVPVAAPTPAVLAPLLASPAPTASAAPTGSASPSPATTPSPAQSTAAAAAPPRVSGSAARPAGVARPQPAAAAAAALPRWATPVVLAEAAVPAAAPARPAVVAGVTGAGFGRLAFGMPANLLDRQLFAFNVPAAGQPPLLALLQPGVAPPATGGATMVFPARTAAAPAAAGTDSFPELAAALGLVALVGGALRRGLRRRRGPGGRSLLPTS